MSKDDEAVEGNAGFSRRQFLSMSGAAAGALVLAACGGDDSSATTVAATTTTGATTATTAGATTTVATTAPGPQIPMGSLGPVTVGYNNPNRLLRAPLFIGQSLGYFEEAGIEIKEINDADDPVPPTVAGSFEIALFDSDVLFDAEDKSTAAGSPLGLRMLNINLGGQPIIMGAAAGISTADDLRGKTVAGAREGTTNEGLAKFILQELGLDWETDVNFINLTGGSNDWVQALLTGQVEATIMFTRHVPVVEAEGGTVLFNDALPAPQGGFGMLQSVIDEDPGFPAAWAHAYIKAQRFVKTLDNQDEVARLLVEDHGIDLPDAFDTVYAEDAGILSQDLGFDPAEMESWLEFLSPFGNIRPDIPWRDFMDVSGLHVAQAALGLDLNPSADLSSGSELIANF